MGKLEEIIPRIIMPVPFIAPEQLEILKNQLGNEFFFSIQADTSADAANKECKVQCVHSKLTDGQLCVRDIGLLTETE